MHVHILQHVPFEGPGRILDWAHSRDHHVTTTPLWQGQLPPQPETFDLLVVMGGPMSVNDELEHRWLSPEKQLIADCLTQGRGVLGICLGAQLIASVLGSRIYPAKHKEIGWFEVQKTRTQPSDDSLLCDLPETFLPLHWHGETFDVPTGATHLASSEACHCQAFQWGDRVLALQFHMETTMDSLKALIQGARSDLTEAPWIQSQQVLEADAARRTSTLGMLLEKVLDRWADSITRPARS